MNVHVVPRFDGRWAVIQEDQVYKFERLWKWYWPLVGCWLSRLPWMWRVE